MKVILMRYLRCLTASQSRTNTVAEVIPFCLAVYTQHQMHSIPSRENSLSEKFIATKNRLKQIFHADVSTSACFCRENHFIMVKLFKVKYRQKWQGEKLRSPGIEVISCVCSKQFFIARLEYSDTKHEFNEEMDCMKCKNVFICHTALITI